MERFNVRALMPLVVLTTLMMGCVGGSEYRQIPSIEDLSPRSVKAGGPTFTLTVIGAHFTDNSVILWNGVARPTIATSNVELRAVIPAADIAVAGTALLSVRYREVDSLAVPSVNAPTGSTSGTPTHPVGPSFAQSAPRSFSITASTASPLNIMTDSLPSSRISQRYNVTLAASGGNPPYTWNLETSLGSLPPGLTLATATGAISGTPSVANHYNFAIEVRDSSGQSATRALSMSVSAAIDSSLNITTTSLSTGRVSQPYNVALSTTGGTPPYTWSLSTSSGPLPPGLTLGTTTGAISGTPSVASQYSFTLRVTDSSSPQQTATKMLSMTTTLGISLDQYGGREDINCTTTGYFHVEKLGDQWWFCTPLGNAFFMQGAYAVDYGLDASYSTLINKKYGSAAEWSTANINRLLGWGFNTLGLYSSAHVIPFATDPSYPVDANGLDSIPIKLPFLTQIRPAYYSMRNPEFTVDYKQQKLLTPGSEVKDIEAGWSPNYKGFLPSYGIADYFDAKMQDLLDGYLSRGTPNLHNSPYVNYLIGMVYDDGDEMYGFGAGPDFPTVPTGHTNPHLSWLVATMTPVQTALQLYPTVYADTTVYTKKAWHDYLVGKYGTIGALNAAWASDYTTFDSSGTVVRGEAVATGDGATLTFAHTMAHLTPTPYSVQIFVNGTPVAGDLGHGTTGTIYGPTGQGGTITYASGLLSLTFTTAPAAGSLITVNYIQNGWGFGTGLMDEDGRPSHQVWLGSDYYGLTDANPNVKTDMDAFLFQTASQYLGMCKTEVRKFFPNVLLLGPDSLGSWQAPPPRQVLQAAATNLDVMIGGVGTSPSPTYQTKLDFVYEYLGDKPLITGAYNRANPDSSWSAFSISTDWPTQLARGQAYYNERLFLPSVAYTTTGSHPFIGLNWFQYTDNRSEKANWGLVSLLDNAYDGNEDRSAVVPCSAPFQTLACGGEPGNYGDAITQVRAANSYWLTH
jgi:hypothetical protein